MTTAWLRVVYVCEFLLATIAVYTGWSQVGGQGHLDLMPWHWKLLLGCGFAVAVVGLTDAAAGQAKAVNRRSVAWFVLVLLLVAGIAAVTYHSHLNEVIEEDPEAEEASTGVLVRRLNC